MVGNLAKFALLILGVTLVYRTGANVLRLWKAGERVQEAESRLAQAKEENVQLKQEAEEVKTPEYMERLAREKLGYGYEGEVVLVMPDDTSAKGEVLSAKEEEPNWKRWRKLYLGF